MFADDRRQSAALDRHLEPPDAPDPPTITDFDDRLIEIGTRVRAWDYDPHHPDWSRSNDARYLGVVTEITEWEGDVDDEGRSIAIAPSVVVRFDDGQTEGFATGEWTGDYWSGPEAGKVEELCAIAAPEVGHARLRAHTRRRA